MTYYVSSGTLNHTHSLHVTVVAAQCVDILFCELGRPFRAVQRFLQAKPLARQLGLPAYILTKATQLVLAEYVTAYVHH